MKRTPPWVWVAAAAVQLAGLGLCVWAMERHLRAESDAERVEQLPGPRRVLAPATRRFAPPLRAAGGSKAPRYITEIADATTQIMAGRAGERSVIFGFYPDGNIRFVDVDDARYSGKAESARARMREDGGTRAFTVQLGVASGQRVEARFTGGTHDGETLVLTSLVEGSVG
jgi:hypothetical protein